MSVQDIKRRAEWTMSLARETREALRLVEEHLVSIERMELAARTAALRESFNGLTATRIVIAGEQNAGKSALINALVGCAVMVPHPLLTTARPIEVSYGDDVRYTVVTRTSDPGQREATDLSHPAFLALAGQADLPPEVTHFVVQVPSRFLRAGIVLIDTPSLSGGLASPEAGLVLGFCQQCDALLLVSDAGQELTAPQAEFLETAQAVGNPLVTSVVSKTDLHSHWERIRDVNSNRLADLGFHGPVLGVSASLFFEGLRYGEAETTSESGIEQLRWYLSAALLTDLLQGHASNSIAVAQGVLKDAKQSVQNEILLQEADRSNSPILLNITKKTQQLDKLSTGISGQVQHELGHFQTRVNTHLQRDLATYSEEVEKIISSGDPVRSWASMQGQICEAGNQLTARHLESVAESRVEATNNLATFAGHEAARLGLIDNIPQNQAMRPPDLGEFSNRRGNQISGFEILRSSMGGLLTTTGTVGTLATLANGTALASASLAAAPFVFPVGLAGALWTFRTMHHRKKDQGVELARQQARKEASRYVNSLGQNLREDTQLTFLAMKKWLIDAINAEVPKLKEELGEEIARLAEAGRLSEDEAASRSSVQTEALSQLNHLQAVMDRLDLTLCRPEMKAVRG